MSRRYRSTPRGPFRLTPIIGAALALVAAAFAGIVPPAGAAPAGCNPLDRGGTECRIGDGGDPAPGGGTTVSVDAGPGPTFKRLRFWFGCESAGGAGWTPVPDVESAVFDLSNPPAGFEPEEPGWLWISELILPDGTATNTGYLTCVGDGVTPPPPPPIPTAAEVWGAALTFEPEVNLDPLVRGLTGLETYMWYEGPTADTVVLTLNGYGVVASIEAVEFQWEMGAADRDGTERYASPDPGSAAAPAADHVYGQPAEAVVIHRIQWTGSAVLTGPGLPAGGIELDLGQAVLAVARAYDVIEVRTPVLGG